MQVSDVFKKSYFVIELFSIDLQKSTESLKISLNAGNNELVNLPNLP